MYNPYQLQYVNGVESANAYKVYPNQQVLLMDSARPRFYIKTADASGFAVVRTYEFSEVKEEPIEYVKKSDFDEFRLEMNNLSELLRSSLETTDKASKGV